MGAEIRSRQIAIAASPGHWPVGDELDSYGSIVEWQRPAIPFSEKIDFVFVAACRDSTGRNGREFVVKAAAQTQTEGSIRPFPFSCCRF
jgi:hypothetical protein